MKSDVNSCTQWQIATLVALAKQETERGRVLVLSAALDESLRRLLAAYLLEHKVSEELLEGSNAPLGTFSARIKSAYALGLINDAEFNDLEVVRKIRNDFAHRIDVSLDSQRLHDLCQNLQMIPKGKTSEGGELTVVLGNDPVFLLTGVALLDALFYRIQPVAKQRRTFTFAPLGIEAKVNPPAAPG